MEPQFNEIESEIRFSFHVDLITNLFRASENRIGSDNLLSVSSKLTIISNKIEGQLQYILNDIRFSYTYEINTLRNYTC